MDKVQHFEIPADDMNRARDFYQNVFGWDIQTWDPNYLMAYTVKVDDKKMPAESGAINGGIVARTTEAPNPVLYITVSDVDKTLEQVASAGGRVITPKSEIPNMLWWARFQDTEGNIVGVAQMMSLSA